MAGAAVIEHRARIGEPGTERDDPSAASWRSIGDCARR